MTFCGNTDDVNPECGILYMAPGFLLRQIWLSSFFLLPFLLGMLREQGLLGKWGFLYLFLVHLVSRQGSAVSFGSAACHLSQIQ
jgi:hypothetical protein